MSRYFRQWEKGASYNLSSSNFQIIKYLKYICTNRVSVGENRPAQLAELPHSEFGPELFPNSTYVKFFVTFATKKPYLTFWDKM